MDYLNLSQSIYLLAGAHRSLAPIDFQRSPLKNVVERRFDSDPVVDRITIATGEMHQRVVQLLPACNNIRHFFIDLLLLVEGRRVKLNRLHQTLVRSQFSLQCLNMDNNTTIVIQLLSGKSIKDLKI